MCLDESLWGLYIPLCILCNREEQNPIKQVPFTRYERKKNVLKLTLLEYYIVHFQLKPVFFSKAVFSCENRVEKHSLLCV